MFDTKYRYLIIDGNNLFWRIFTIALQKYVMEEEFEILPGSLSEALHSVKKLQSKYGSKDAEVFILFDNPDTVLNLRKVIDENYKSIRMQKNAPKGLYKSLSIFIQLCKIFDDSFRVLQVGSLEADDLTKPVIDYFQPTQKSKCLCISNDLDWARNIEKDVHWFNWSKIYTLEEFEKEKGFSPKSKKIQLYKILRGDNSDNIPGLLKAKKGEKDELELVLLYILHNYNDVNEMYKGIVNNQELPDYWKKRLFDIEHEAYKNDMLVDFLPVEIDLKEEVIYGKRNLKLLRVWYDSLKLPYETFMHDKKDPFFKKGAYKIVDIKG